MHGALRGGMAEILWRVQRSWPARPLRRSVSEGAYGEGMLRPGLQVGLLRDRCSGSPRAVARTGKAPCRSLSRTLAFEYRGLPRLQLELLRLHAGGCGFESRLSPSLMGAVAQWQSAIQGFGASCLGSSLLLLGITSRGMRPR
jgi:hypothetical protein